MPAVQTTYTRELAVAYEGMLADSRDHTILSRQVETAAGIGFGKVTVVGATDYQVRVAEASRAFSGLSEAAHWNQGATPSDTYPQYATIPVMMKGSMWVLASVAVAKGDPVYFVPATGVLTNVVGVNTLIVGARWETTTAGAGLAIVYLG